MLHGGDVRRLANPAALPLSASRPGMPGATQLTVKFPLSRSPCKRYVASYAADHFAFFSIEGVLYSLHNWWCLLFVLIRQGRMGGVQASALFFNVALVCCVGFCGWALFGNCAAGKRPRGGHSILNFFLLLLELIMLCDYITRGYVLNILDTAPD